ETLNQTLNNLAEYRSQTLEEAAAPASGNTQDKDDIQYLSKRAKNFWDSCRDLQWNAPELDLDTFCEVVLAAHITNLLIRQDLECTYDKADKTRVESIHYGDIYDGLGSSEEESDKFDDIFRNIVAEGKKVKVTAVSTQANNQDIAMVAVPPRFLRKDTPHNCVSEVPSALLNDVSPPTDDMSDTRLAPDDEVLPKIAIPLEAIERHQESADKAGPGLRRSSRRAVPNPIPDNIYNTLLK
ncbi:hypothetical protein CVT25_005216, partial [Psilocybe cyanescens]